MRSLLGVVVHATVANVRMGELCHLVDPGSGRRVLAEVIALSDDTAVLTPIGELTGLSSLTEVVPTGDELRVSVGPGLLGRVISAIGEPLDQQPWPPRNIEGTRPVAAEPVLDGTGGIGAAAPAAIAAGPERIRALEDDLCASLADALMLEGDAIDRDLAFRELGLDSITGASTGSMRAPTKA